MDNHATYKNITIRNADKATVLERVAMENREMRLMSDHVVEIKWKGEANCLWVSSVDEIANDWEQLKLWAADHDYKEYISNDDVMFYGKEV